MADRATTIIADKSPLRGMMSAWKNFNQSQHKPQATGFGTKINRLEPGDQARAFLIYAGHFEKSDADYLNLNWLKDFAASNRQLHNLHAHQLLKDWSKAKNKKTNHAEIVQNLSIDGPSIFEKSPADFLQIFSKAFSELLSSDPKTSAAGIDKSIAIFYAVTAFKGLDTYRILASDLFTSHIDKIIFADGGPQSRQTPDVINLLSKMLPLKTTARGLPQSTHDTVSRMMSFVAMLEANHPTLKAYQDPKQIIPAVAPLSGFARLAQGKSVLTLNANDHQNVEFFDDGLKLFTCRTQHDVSDSKMEHQSLPQGELLQLNRRRLFLSQNGKDLRCEDHSTDTIFIINPALKVSPVRDGGIMFVTPKHQHWLLTLRGGEVLLEKNGAILKILHSQDQVNWAFKKQEKAQKQSPRKAQDLPDLLS